MDTLFPKVLQAVAGENFTVYLYFNVSISYILKKVYPVLYS